MNMDQFISERMLAKYRELASASTSTARRHELLRGLHEEGRDFFAYDRAARPGAAERSVAADAASAQRNEPAAR